MEARLGRLQGRGSIRGGSTLDRARQGFSGPPGASSEADSATVELPVCPNKAHKLHLASRQAPCGGFVCGEIERETSELKRGWHWGGLPHLELTRRLPIGRLGLLQIEIQEGRERG